MKKLVLATLSLVFISQLAQAQTVELTGSAAESFIERHFPNAEIPGHLNGTFLYINKNGKTKRGYAECFYPPMGARSDGVETTCTVIY